MIITIIRSGGFAGLSLTKNIDTTKLSPEKAHLISQNIVSGNFFSLPEVDQTPNKPDKFTYKITIKNNGQEHTIIRDEQSLPKNLQKSIEELLY